MAASRKRPGDAPRRSDGYHHGDLRRALLDATLKLVDERGPEGFTLRAASRLAGVSDAAPYHHFADKDALLAAVAEEGFRELDRALTKAADRTSTPALAHALALGTAYVMFAVEHPSHYRVMFSRGLDHVRHPDVATAAAAAFQRVRDALLAAAVAHGRVLPTEQLIYASWGLVHGLSFLAIDGLLGNVAEDRERLRSLVSGALEIFAERDA